MKNYILLFSAAEKKNDCLLGSIVKHVGWPLAVLSLLFIDVFGGPGLVGLQAAGAVLRALI